LLAQLTDGKNHNQVKLLYTVTKLREMCIDLVCNGSLNNRCACEIIYPNEMHQTFYSTMIQWDKRGLGEVIFWAQVTPSSGAETDSNIFCINSYFVFFKAHRNYKYYYYNIVKLHIYISI